MIPAGMARNVARLIERYSSGAVTLNRVTRAAPDSASQWTPGAAVVDTYTLDARVNGVAAEYVDGTLILATDLMVIASPKARQADGTIVDLVPRLSDKLQVNGAEKVIKKIEAVPASGTPVRFHIFIAS